MFLDAGALLEENGWRGFALPVLLRSHGPLVAWALIYLSAFSFKIVAISVVMTYFWAQAGQATLLAIAMHGLSNDVARVGGLVDGSSWQVDALSEVNLAAPFIVVACFLVPWANRHGWGNLRSLLARTTTDPCRG